MTRVAAWLCRRWWVVLIAAALVVAVGLGIALSLYQLSQTQPLMDQASALSAGEARLVRQREVQQFQVDNLAKIWTTLVQAVVGVVLAVGAVATWRNLKATQDKLEIDRQAQITNRFTQAITQLGAEHSLLDSYGEERAPVAAQVLEWTHNLVPLGTVSHPVKRALRDTIVPLASRVPVVQQQAVRRMS